MFYITELFHIRLYNFVPFTEETIVGILNVTDYNLMFSLIKRICSCEVLAVTMAQAYIVFLF